MTVISSTATYGPASGRLVDWRSGVSFEMPRNDGVEGKMVARGGDHFLITPADEQWWISICFFARNQDPKVFAWSPLISQGREVPMTQQVPYGPEWIVTSAEWPGGVGWRATLLEEGEAAPRITCSGPDQLEDWLAQVGRTLLASVRRVTAPRLVDQVREGRTDAGNGLASRSPLPPVSSSSPRSGSCPECGGLGTKPCESCGGTGFHVVSNNRTDLDGVGYFEQERIPCGCQAGQTRCIPCGGSGREAL